MADRLATRGDNAQQAIARTSSWPARCIGPRSSRGRRTATSPRSSAATSSPRALGIAPGPRARPLLAEIAAARYAGEVTTRDEAIELARGRYSLRGMSDDCIFCKIVAGELPATIVDSDERTIAFMDINPATRGHALVIPRAHATTCSTIDPEDLRPARSPRQRLAAPGEGRASAPTASTCSTACGAAAWQTVFHFHVHVIPRYKDDPERDALRLPWIPARATCDDIAAAGEELTAHDAGPPRARRRRWPSSRSTRRR